MYIRNSGKASLSQKHWTLEGDEDKTYQYLKEEYSRQRKCYIQTV